MARIGLYGGTFNPIHLGHLRSAVEVRESAGLDAVWLVPAHRPPHKEPGDLAPASDRLAMIERALATASELRVEPIELAREDPSYTLDTLRLLRERHPGTEFVLVLGFDAFCDLHTWYQYESLLAGCDFIVTTRPPHRVARGPNPALIEKLPIAVTRGFCYQENIGCYLHESGHRLEFVPVTQLDISASSLRAAVGRGASIRYLVPDTVLAYIVERGLYRNES